MSNTDHYFNDSNGELWVNVSQIDNVALVPVKSGQVGEISLGVSEVQVEKQAGDLAVWLSSEGQDELEDFNPLAFSDD